MGGVSHKPDLSFLTDGMAFVGFLHMSFLFLLHRVLGEELEPTFRAVGSTIEWGYCFGVDYIVLYKRGPDGDQLLSNSSDDTQPPGMPADLHGGIYVNNNKNLLGLQMRQLTYSDSGVYRRECWKNQTRVSHRSQQLFVCGEEVGAEEVFADQGGGQTELRCNHTSTGTSVRWYYDVERSSRLQLFVDTSVSLRPLVDQLEGVVKVKHGGTSLLINNTLLKQKQEFYCVVANGQECLSFQNMPQSVHTELRTIFASAGDKVELNCPFESEDQEWETPLGNINGSSGRDNHMYIQSDPPDQYTLVIPRVSAEHGGEYSCVSATLDLQYSLSLCPHRRRREKELSGDGGITLECGVGRDDRPQRVLWFRREPAGESKLILDSDDEMASIPEHLRGRMSLSKTDFALMFSHVDQEDGGLYQCVAIEGTEPLEYDYDDTEDYDVEEADVQYWYDTPRCLFRQETQVIWRRSGSIPESAIAAMAAVVVLVGGLVAGMIVAMVVIRNRTRAAQSQGRPKQRRNKTTMGVQPECMEKLNPV